METLKKSLVALEGKIAQAKTKKDMLKARAQAAKAQQQLQSAVGNIGTDSAGAFGHMEDKVEALEATGGLQPSWLGLIWPVRFSGQQRWMMSWTPAYLKGDLKRWPCNSSETVGSKR